MNIENGHVETLKRLDFLEILSSYGYTPKQKSPTSYLMNCPFHEDRTPSFSISLVGSRWLWHCFGCGKGGDLVRFVMLKENLTYSEALKKFIPQNDHPNTKSKPDLLKTVVDFYHKTFFEDKRGIDYLRSRGIKSEEIFRSFKIGFSNGSLKNILSPKSEYSSLLKEIGILNDQGNEIFYNCIVMPLYDQDQNPVGLYGRNIKEKRHLYLKGPHKGLLNLQGARDTDKIILTESIIDALSLYEMGIKNILPCYGINGFTDHHKALLIKEKIKKVELCFDRDPAGESGSKELAQKLTVMGIKTTSIKLPDNIKDANDFLVSKKTKIDFELLPREVLVQPAEDIYEVQSDKDILYLRTAGREYRIRMGERESASRLRVNIKLTILGKSHIDVLDLFSQRQRSSYSKKISKEFAVPQESIEKDLYRLIEEMEKFTSQTQTSEDSPSVMTESERGEALKTLKSPNLMRQIVEDLGKIGCVGEDTAKLLGYIVTISRRLEQPLSMIIVSQSGAGKSNLADTLESVVPKEECLHLSRITPQALYYMDRDALKRKVLIIEEKEGSEAADYSIRVLQSKKALRLAAPLKDPQTGKIRTTTFEVEGPLVVIETTTKTDLNPENTSRCYIIYLDESEEQTKRIHAFQRRLKTIEGVRAKREAESTRRKHQNMQRLLRPLVVSLPFAEHIKFPTKWMRVRRDYLKFLNLIEAVTFLHQYQREVKLDSDNVEYIEATEDDYRMAYEISKEVFGDSLSELMKPDKDFLDLMRTLLEEKNQTRFSRRQAREYSGLPDHVVRRRLEILVSLEYLTLAEGKNGTRFEYELNPYPIQAQEIIQGLTTPEDLATSATKASADLTGTLREPCSKVNSFKLNGITSPCELAQESLRRE